jgi:hypothetical protein
LPVIKSWAFCLAVFRLTARARLGEGAESAGGVVIDISLGVDAEAPNGEWWSMTCGKCCNNAWYGRFQFMKVLRLSSIGRQNVGKLTHNALPEIACEVKAGLFSPDF